MSTATSTPTGTGSEPGRRQAAHKNAQGTKRGRVQQRWLPWAFLAPTIAGMGIFTLLPIVASIALAFFRWDIISAPTFVGFDNFAEVVQDPTVRVSFLNTIVFVVVAVALQLGLALGLAIMVQEKLPAWLRVFFRSAFFFPLILSAASVSIFMRYLFNEQFGVVNCWHPRGSLADDARWVGRRRDSCLCVAELRVLVPAVHRRARLHSGGDLRGRVH